ncbi:MAG: hypothetical protein GX416_05020 [Bacteroidales bacterium]|nr:hypothetical protein [Bacteroidales bacterium]
MASKQGHPLMRSCFSITPLSFRSGDRSRCHCYLLTAEQAEYCVQHKSTTTYLDVLFDKYVAKEILIVGDNAKIVDICKAREFLDRVDGNFKEAQKLYNEYIRNERGINLTNDNLLPF